MKKETVFVLAMAVIVLSCAGYSNATVLGTIESNRAGSSLGTPPEMILSICYPLTPLIIPQGEGGDSEKVPDTFNYPDGGRH